MGAPAVGSMARGETMEKGKESKMTNQQRDAIREKIQTARDLVDRCSIHARDLTLQWLDSALAELAQPNTGSPVTPPASPEGERDPWRVLQRIAEGPHGADCSGWDGLPECTCAVGVARDALQSRVLPQEPASGAQGQPAGAAARDLEKRCAEYRILSDHAEGQEALLREAMEALAGIAYESDRKSGRDYLVGQQRFERAASVHAKLAADLEGITRGE
jgi:hypothetical protein